MSAARPCCDTYPPEPHAENCNGRSCVNGDLLLSSNDIGIWQLVQHVLLTWNVLVMVKRQSYDVPRQSPGSVTFFVPRDATFCGEIVSFLESEGRQFETPAYAAAPGRPRVPPTIVEVVTCSAPLSYIDVERSQKIAREAVSNMLQRLKDAEDDPVAAAVKRERAEVDELLSKRQDECICTLEKHETPCDACFELSRVRGMLKARADQRKAKS